MNHLPSWQTCVEPGGRGLGQNMAMADDLPLRSMWQIGGTWPHWVGRNVLGMVQSLGQSPRLQETSHGSGGLGYCGYGDG